MNCAAVTAADVDKEVMELLKDSYEEAKRLLREHRSTLDQIAEFLITRETITGKEFMDIFHRVEGITPDDENKDSGGSRINLNQSPVPDVINLPDTQAERLKQEAADAGSSDLAQAASAPAEQTAVSGPAAPSEPAAASEPAASSEPAEAFESALPSESADAFETAAQSMPETDTRPADEMEDLSEDH